MESVGLVPATWDSIWVVSLLSFWTSCELIRSLTKPNLYSMYPMDPLFSGDASPRFYLPSPCRPTFIPSQQTRWVLLKKRLDRLLGLQLLVRDSFRIVLEFSSWLLCLPGTAAHSPGGPQHLCYCPLSSQTYVIGWVFLGEDLAWSPWILSGCEKVTNQVRLTYSEEMWPGNNAFSPYEIRSESPGTFSVI